MVGPLGFNYVPHLYKLVTQNLMYTITLLGKAGTVIICHLSDMSNSSCNAPYTFRATA